MGGQITSQMWDSVGPRCYLDACQFAPTQYRMMSPPLPNEESLWGCEENDHLQQATLASAPQADAEPNTLPVTQTCTPIKTLAGHASSSPLWDIEVCTAVQLAKKPKRATLGSTIP